MIFSIMSRQEAKRYSYLPYGLKTIFISITDVNEPDNNLKTDWTNCLGILRLKFEDVDFGWDDCITPEQGSQIVDFVNSHPEAEQIVVHCEAGVSRSAGVCAALKYAMTGNDMDIFRNGRYCPNMACYRTVLDACERKGFGLFKPPEEEEIRSKDLENICAWKRINYLD